MSSFIHLWMKIWHFCVQLSFHNVIVLVLLFIVSRVLVGSKINCSSQRAKPILGFHSSDNESPLYFVPGHINVVVKNVSVIIISVGGIWWKDRVSGEKKRWNGGKCNAVIPSGEKCDDWKAGKNGDGKTTSRIHLTHFCRSQQRVLLRAQPWIMAATSRKTEQKCNFPLGKCDLWRCLILSIVPLLVCQQPFCGQKC